MPYDFSKKLQNTREELDQHELSEDNIRNAEIAYLELTEYANFKKVNCVINDELRTIENIGEEVYNFVIEELY